MNTVYFPSPIQFHGKLSKKVETYITSAHIPTLFETIFQSGHKLKIDKGTKHVFYIDAHGSCGANVQYFTLDTIKSAHMVHYGCPAKTVLLDRIISKQNHQRKYIPFNKSNMVCDMRIYFKKTEVLERSCITHINLIKKTITTHDMRFYTDIRVTLNKLISLFSDNVQEQFETYVNTCRSETTVPTIRFESRQTRIDISPENGVDHRNVVQITKDAYKRKHIGQYVILKHKNKLYLIYNKRVSKQMRDFAASIPRLHSFLSINNLEMELSNVINLTK